MNFIATCQAIDAQDWGTAIDRSARRTDDHCDCSLMETLTAGEMRRSLVRTIRSEIWMTLSSRYIDTRTGQLLDALDEDDVLIWRSDHGIATSLSHGPRAVWLAVGDKIPRGDRLEGPGG